MLRGNNFQEMLLDEGAFEACKWRQLLKHSAAFVLDNWIRLQLGKAGITQNRMDVLVIIYFTTKYKVIVYLYKRYNIYSELSYFC